MKILFVVQRFPPAIGGTEQIAENLANYLSERHDVTVFTTTAFDLDSFWDPNAKKIKENNTGRYNLKRFEIVQPSQVSSELAKFPFAVAIPGPFSPTMWKEIIESGSTFDLIVVTSFPYNHVIPAYYIAKNSKVPIISIPHIHFEFPEIYLTGLRLALLNESDAIVSNSQTDKDMLCRYNIPQDKIHVIPPSIDLDSWSQVKAIDIHSKLGISKESVLVLFSGFRSKEKGIIFLIESLKKLWEQKINIDLVLIGPSSLDYDSHIKHQKKNVRRHIHDLGIVSNEEKMQIFNSCDIFALPSKSESFGIGYLEGWACKKPVVGCNISVVREVISDNKNGMLVDFDNVMQLSKALERLAKDSGLRDSFGRYGFEIVISKHDSGKNLQMFEKLCESITT